MSITLDFFPIVSEDRLTDYIDQISEISNRSARDMIKRHRGTFESKKYQAFIGWQCKTAAALARGLNPLEVLDYQYDSQNPYENFIKVGDESSDAFSSRFEGCSEDGKIIISLTQGKAKGLMNRISWAKSRIDEGNSEKAEKDGYAPTYMEFIQYDKKEELFYHLGLLETGGLCCPNFPEMTGMNEYGDRYLFEFDVSKSKRDDGVYLLTT